MDNTGDRQIQLATVLVDKPYPFRLTVGDIAANKFPVVQILDEFP